MSKPDKKAMTQSQRQNGSWAIFSTFANQRGCMRLMFDFQHGINGKTHVARERCREYLLDGKVYNPGTGVSRELDLSSCEDKDPDFAVCELLVLKKNEYDKAFPLHLAIVENELEFAEWIVEDRPDMVTTMTALCALRHGHLDFARWLHKHQRFCYDESNIVEIARDAISKNNFEIIKCLEELEVELIVDDVCLAICSCRDENILAFIFENWTRRDNVSIAVQAIMSNNLRVLHHVLNDAFQKEPDEWTKLAKALGRSGHIDLVDLLVVRFPPEGPAKVMDAALVDGRSDMVQYLHTRFSDITDLYAKNHADLSPPDDSWKIVRDIDTFKLLQQVNYNLNYLVPGTREVGEFMLQSGLHFDHIHVDKTLQRLGTRETLDILKFFDAVCEPSTFRVEQIHTALEVGCSREVVEYLDEILRRDKTKMLKLRKEYKGLMRQALQKRQGDLVKFFYEERGVDFGAHHLEYALSNQWTLADYILENMLDNMDGEPYISKGAWLHFSGTQIDFAISNGVKPNPRALVERLAALGQVERMQRLEHHFKENSCFHFHSEVFYDVVRNSRTLENPRMLMYLLGLMKRSGDYRQQRRYDRLYDDVIVETNNPPYTSKYRRLIEVELREIEETVPCYTWDY